MEMKSEINLSKSRLRRNQKKRILNHLDEPDWTFAVAFNTWYLPIKSTSIAINYWMDSTFPHSSENHNVACQSQQYINSEQISSAQLNFHNIK